MWSRVSPTMWLLRACLLAVGIEALEGIHGWPRLIPVALAVCALISLAWEYVRRRRVALRR